MLGKIDASLNAKLESVKWGEYRLGDLFEIQKTLGYNTDSLVVGNEYDYVTRTSMNQGIMRTTGFVGEDRLNPAGVWSLGLLQMDFFYRNREWYAGQFMRKIVPKFSLSPKIISFITTLLNKQKRVLLSVLVRDVDDTFNNLTIKLPVNNGNIDFKFMENFIEELEAESIAKLEAYLKITGLSNYELSESERKAIENFNNLEWGTFNLEKLFGKSTRGKRLKSADRIAGNLPFVTAGEANEGVSAFIGNNVEIFKANTTTIDMFGSAKYRNYNYGGDDHVAIVHTENIPKYSAIFTTTAIHKSAHTGKFSYDLNFYAKDADKLIISLPIKDNEPDYDIMSCIVSAIHKLVIRSVVSFTDKKIATTKKIVTEQ